MSMLNNVNLTGRVTADLEMQERGETKYIRFSFANEEVYGDKKKHTNFLPIIAYNKTAENMSNAGVKKGSYIWITGTIHQSTKESNGKKYNNVGIILNRWGYCGYTKDENAQAQQSGAAPQVPPPPQNPYPVQPAQGTVPPPVEPPSASQQTGQAPPPPPPAPAYAQPVPPPPAPPASGFEGIDLDFPPDMDADDDDLPF